MPLPTLFETRLHKGLRRQESTRAGTKTGGACRTFRAGKSLGAGALKVLLVCAALSAWPARAVIYDFFTVTITSTNTAKITSPNGNGYITVTTVGSKPLLSNSTDIPTNEFPNLFLARSEEH